jgi:hypothetical protein
VLEPGPRFKLPRCALIGSEVMVVPCLKMIIYLNLLVAASPVLTKAFYRDPRTIWNSRNIDVGQAAFYGMK